MSIDNGLNVPATLVAGATTLNMAATGGSWTIGSGRRPVHGVGKRGPFDSIPTNVTLNITVDAFVAYDASLADALNLINSADGAELTEVTLTIGTKEITGKLSALSLKIDVENELSMSITVEGKAADTGTATLLTSATAFSPNSIVFTNLGASVKASTFNLNITNGVFGRRYMGATRTPAVLPEGKQLVAFDMTMLEIPSVPADITAAALAKIAAPTVAISDTQAVPKVLTITFTNALPVEQSGNLNIEDILEHGIKYEAEAVSFGVA